MSYTRRNTRLQVHGPVAPNWRDRIYAKLPGGAQYSQIKYNNGVVAGEMRREEQWRGCEVPCSWTHGTASN